jgi:hypothetical protein
MKSGKEAEEDEMLYERLFVNLYSIADGIEYRVQYCSGITYLPR